MNLNRQIQPLLFKKKFHLNYKHLMLLIAMILFSIPSITNTTLPIPGFKSDINSYQIIILLTFISLFFNEKISYKSFTVKKLSIIFGFIIIFNIFRMNFGIPDEDIYLMRGIFNCSFNLMITFIVSSFFNNWLTVKSFSNITLIYGIIISISAIFEFILLRVSMPMLEKWRIFVWGNLDSEMLFRAGGVILNSDGLARVGGLIGAPENLGYILSLTIPIFILADTPSIIRILTLSIYTISSLVSGSRGLPIVIIFYSILLFTSKSKYYSKDKILFLIIFAILISTSIYYGLNSDALSRFSNEAFIYEWNWRIKRLVSAISIMDQNWFYPILGIGLGWGIEEKFELWSFTSGLLGGDFVVAYCLGGFIGIGILITFWKIVIKYKILISSFGEKARISINLFILFTFGLSLIMPVFTQLFLGSAMFPSLMIANLLIWERLIREKRLKSFCVNKFEI